MRYLLTTLLLLPVLLSAQELHTFENGEVADADKINENFQTLDSGLKELQSSVDTSEVLVNCEDDSSALQTALNEGGRNGLARTFKVSGTCEMDLYTGIFHLTTIYSTDGATLKPGQQPQGFFLLQPGYGGHLSLSGLTLIDAYVSANYNGIISLNTVSFQRDQFGAQIEANRGAAIVTFGEILVSDSLDALTINASTGSSVAIRSRKGTFRLSLSNGSSAECRVCSGNHFTWLAVQGNSSFSGADSQEQHLSIDQLSVGNNSSFIQTSGACNAAPYNTNEVVDASSIITVLGNPTC